MVVGEFRRILKFANVFPHPAFAELRHPSPEGRREAARSSGSELT